MQTKSKSDSLATHHQQQLKASAIADDVIAERGYRTITDPAQLKALGFASKQCRTPGLLIPLHSVDGDQALHVFRPDTPRTYDDKRGKRNPDGTWPQKVIKYETPQGETIRLDCPPRCLPRLADPAVPLWVTEGQKKADALTSAGLSAIAILGVWNWLTKHRDEIGKTDWGFIKLKGRTVNIVFDSDLMSKPQVRHALDALTKYLQRKGATVNAVVLPNDPKRGKIGVDDWLSSGHTVAELQNLIDAPRPAPQLPPAQIELLDSAPLIIRRPLALINGRAYAAIWPYTRVTHHHILAKGQIETLPQPRVIEERQLIIVRDDGARFGEGVQFSFADLEHKHHLPEVPAQGDKLWSTPGVKLYLDGYRPDPADVFWRVSEVVSHFIDFESSLADQRTMSEMIACFILSTWFLEMTSVSGALWMHGEKGCGKTQLLLVVCELSHLGQALTTSSSPASVRDIAEYGATLGFDDAEILADPQKTDPDIRALLLAGNRRGVPVTLKEQSPNGQWVTRHVNAFCPKVFSSINKPDDVLSSRAIIVPLVRTPDRERGNADPFDPRQWPHDRRTLIDDLWALALSRLVEVVQYDSVVGEHARLTGRDLQPWRGILVASAWLNAHGVPGLWERMESLAADKYQVERLDLEVADMTKVIVTALVDLCKQDDPAKREWQFATAEIVEQVKRAIADKEIDLDVEKVTARGLGRRLGKMRLVHDVNTKPKGWRISRRLVTRLCGAYKLTPPDENAEISRSETPEPVANVEGVEGVEGVEARIYVNLPSTSSLSSTPSTFLTGDAPTKSQIRPCSACGQSVWWERPASAGGGLVCVNCHPNPNGQ